MEMDPEHQLEDAQQKLSEFRNRLDLLVQSVWGSRNVDPNDVLVAVNQLQSLVEWVTQQSDLGPESAMLVVQLQELLKIRQNLEMTPSKAEGKISPQLTDEQGCKVTNEPKCNSKQELEFSDVKDAIESESVGEMHRENNQIVPYTPAPFFGPPSTIGNTASFNSNSAVSNADNSSLEFVKATESDLEIKCENNENSEPRIVAEKDFEAQDLLSDDIDLLIKSNADIQDLLSSNSTIVTYSDTEIQDLICTSPDVLTSSSIEMKDFLSCDASIISNGLDIVTNPSSEMQDLLLDETDIISKNNTDLHNVLPDDLDILTQTNTEFQDMYPIDTAAVLKSDMKMKGLFFNDLNGLTQPNKELQDLVSNDYEPFSEKDVTIKDDLETLSQPKIDVQVDIAAILNNNIEAKDVFSNCLANLTQPNEEIKDMFSVDSESASKNNKETKDLRSNKTDTSTEVITKPKHLLSTDTTDMLKSNDAVSSKKPLEVESFSQDSISNIKPMRNEVIILETDEDDKTSEWINDPKSSNDPLDICMFAIRNLYDSLRVKENELLKLSVMQNDQKHIDALQGVIIDFHKDITNLNRQLDKTKKENNLLKEQVLELEEAENDARLDAQKLEQKLVFLQEKDSHSQAEICHLKQSFKKSFEKLAEKELVEKELRSQIKFMETLVQKYEDQIKVAETKVIALSKRDLKEKNNYEDTKLREKAHRCDRGTQTYPFKTKLDCSILMLNDTSSDNVCSSESSIETNQEYIESESTHCETEIKNSFMSKSAASATEAINVEDQFAIANKDGITHKELSERLQKLMNEDIGLQQQIHNVDQINLELWKKLQCLETNIGDCKRKDINETDLTVSDSEGKRVSHGASDTNLSDLSNSNLNNIIPEENLISLDQNEQYIKDRLTLLEEINVSFEEELKTREHLCKEQEIKYDKWKQTEKRLISDLKQLTVQRDSLVNQVEKLKKEKEKLEQQVIRQQVELSDLVEKNQMEVAKLRTDQESMTIHLHHKVNQLITKEKELLKMIKNMKSERNKNQDKSELERLKSNYIQLQLELSNSREEIRKLEDSFKIRIDECVSKHAQEESHLTTELEHLRNANMRCDKTIQELQLKQQHLMNALEQKEKELQLARETFKKSLEDTEDVHRSVETELKSRLQKMEEGTVIVTNVLMEERMRVEKELHENIEDLRAKEEFYKSKISELELDVIHLHKELHKVSDESEIEMDIPMVQGNDPENPNTQRKSPTITSVRNDMQNGSHSLDQSEVLVSDLSQSSRVAVSVASMTVVNQLKSAKETKSDAIPYKSDSKGENVEHLRAQVRELQAQLEKISDEVSEISPVSSGPAITAPCMGLQKEELDYAEVDECVAEWRKPALNLPPTKNVPQQYQQVYADRYAPRYKNKFTEEKASDERESSDENDYDEVLPRPTNFHVVQQVGQDTLLVGWNYVNPSVLEGFEVYLDNQVHERIYIPDRTKALISGLNLRRPLHLSICALSRYGQVSEPADLELSCQPDMNSRCFEDEEDEYKDFEDSFGNKHRPYSMEW